jgi:hypothetical protein
MRPVGATTLALMLALLAPAGAQQPPPQELPKGMFPGAVPPVSAPAESRPPTSAPSPQSAPPAPTQPGAREVARDPLGRVAVPAAAPVVDLAGVLSPQAA